MSRFPIGYQNSDWRYSKDTLWLKVHPKEFKLDAMARGGKNMGTYSADPIFFVMPNDYTPSITHDWKELNTVAGAAREVGAGASRAVAANGGAGIPGANLAVKNDQPIIYDNTPRANYQIEIELQYFRSAKDEVYAPIEKLLKYCAPGNPGGQIAVTLPWVFEISTIKGDGSDSAVLFVKDAAITSIQPTYSAPYVDGYPSKAKLSMTFLDLNPYYKDSVGRPTVTIS